MSTQITIEGIEQPREGAKMGSVKAGGRYYKVWPDKLDGFAVGSTYEVETETNEFKGKTFHKIKTSKLVGGNGNGNAATKPNVTQSAHSPSSAPGEDRSSRIERQHSQEMALRYFHIRGTIPEDNMTAVRSMIDWFQRDVSHVPTAPASENAHRLDAMRDKGMHGGVGEEGDFQL